MDIASFEYVSSPKFESKPTSTVLWLPICIKYVEFDRASPQLLKGVDGILSILHETGVLHLRHLISVPPWVRTNGQEFSWGKL